MSMGDSFAAGFDAMSNATARKRQNDLDKLRLDFEVEQRKKELDQQKEMTNRRIDFDAEQAAKDREFRANEAQKGRDYSSTEADKGRAFQANESATNRLDTTLRDNRNFIANYPAQQAHVDFLKAQAAALASKDPNSALVEQPIDPGHPELGKVSFRVPRDQFQRNQELEQQRRDYRSPYATAITAAESEIADQQKEMAAGDMRKGFLGLGGSRKSVVDQKSKQLLRLKGLELQDMVQKGILSREEADKRAEALLAQ